MRIASLTSVDLPAAARVLAAAFQEDPAAAFLDPSPVRRARVLPQRMAAYLRFGLLCGRVDVALDPEPVAAAVWLPSPGLPSISLSGLWRSGLVGLMVRQPPSTFFRGLMLDNALGLLSSELYRTPHWYLMLLGVSPAEQRRGLGSALIRAGAAEADAERVPCYLHTEREANLAFYASCGFEVARTGQVSGGGPRVWLLRRG
jgi:ribosomal protein S18 acetylase RimI-like enzyme